MGYGNEWAEGDDEDLLNQTKQFVFVRMFYKGLLLRLRGDNTSEIHKQYSTAVNHRQGEEYHFPKHI